MEDLEVGVLTPGIENGTLNHSAAVLMQAGFYPRKAAIFATTSKDAAFTNSSELKTGYGLMKL